ncbi:MAG: radical SAM protein [bacterium]|nr:radical SAM protein [bacterium]
MIFPRTTVFENPRVYPPLGMWSLMAVLKGKGHEVTFQDMSELVTDQSGSRPIGFEDIPMDKDVYLIGGTSPQTQQMIALGKFLRENGKILVAGGPHVSNNAGPVLGEQELATMLIPNGRDLSRFSSSARELLSTFHVLVKSEGERSVVEAIARLDEGKRSMDRFGRGIVLRHPFIPREEMKEIPIPDRTYSHLYQVALYDEAGKAYPTTTAFTSRGCPEECAFCDSPSEDLWSRGTRYADLGRVEEEFDDIYARGYRGVYFYDDILPLHKERTLEMYRMLAQRGMVSRCNLRTDIISKPNYGYEFLKQLRDHGLVDVFVGVESASNRIKDGIQKGTTIEQDTLVLKWCKDLGIKFKASMILPLPGETEETAKLSRQWVLRERPHKVNVCLFIPFTGTPIVKTVYKARGGNASLPYRTDVPDYDINWDADESEMEKLFYAGSRKRGGLTAITYTSSFCLQQIQDFYHDWIEEIEREGIPY